LEPSNPEEASAVLAPSAVQACLRSGAPLERELLLAPFCATADLLRLSEAARWLLPYRSQLASVRIRARPDVDVNMQVGRKANVSRVPT
jgi:hypothetical protein